MRYLHVRVRDQGADIPCHPESSPNLRELLLKHKVTLYKGLAKIGNCMGHGICGTCVVRVVDNPAGLTDRTEKERKRLGPTNPQARLACQAWVCGDITIDCRKTDLDDELELRAEAKEARPADAPEKASYVG